MLYPTERVVNRRWRLTCARWRALFKMADNLWTNTVLGPDEYAQPVLVLIALGPRESLYGIGIDPSWWVNPNTAACTLTSEREVVTSGAYVEMSDLSSLRTFVTEFAGHIAAKAARAGAE